MRPNEKTRTVAMKPSMKAAKTEHTAPEIMPITMSPSRQYTLEAFPARLTVSSLAAMHALGAEFARLVRQGDVIAIEGPMGSGKTAFVGGLAAALVGGDPVTSPTFTFWHHYGDATNGLEHLDLYRVEEEADLAELGLEDAFSPTKITAVEWPERAPNLVGASAWHIQISGSGDSTREVTIHKRA
jgi:tRNA threonylcarbamoyl adenosine modification protein YjeE